MQKRPGAPKAPPFPKSVQQENNVFFNNPQGNFSNLEDL